MSEPDRQNHFLTFLSFSVEGSGEEPNKKLKGNGFGRAVARGTRAMWRGVVVVRAPQGARESTRSVPLPIQDFPQKKFGFRPKGTANLRFCQKRQNCEQSEALQKSRFARKGLNLQRFATLRVGKKKCFGFGFGSSSCLSGEKNYTRLRTSFAFAKQPIFFVSPIGETWKR